MAPTSARRGARTQRDPSAPDQVDRPENPAGPGARRGSGERAQTPEHFGPLSLTRLHKDDGRALMLYAAADAPADADARSQMGRGT